MRRRESGEPSSMTRELVRVIEAIYPKEDVHCPKITKSKGRSCPSRTGLTRA